MWQRATSTASQASVWDLFSDSISTIAQDFCQDWGSVGAEDCLDAIYDGSPKAGCHRCMQVPINIATREQAKVLMISAQSTIAKHKRTER
jgi:hypothetical protein